MNVAPPPALEACSSVHTSNFPALLRQIGGSLLVTTFQAGRVILMGSPAINTGSNVGGFAFDQRGRRSPALGPWMLGLLSALLAGAGLLRRRGPS